MAFHEFVVFTMGGGDDDSAHSTLTMTESGSLLRFEDESVFSPYAKFRVERTDDNNGFVHIRSCYNNKYWTRSASAEYQDPISATAEERVEDESVENSTLFRLEVVGDTRVRLFHVRSGQIRMLPPSQGLSRCLSVNQGLEDEFLANIVDPTTLVKLPRRVAFKGEYNERYMANFNNLNKFHLTEYGPRAANYEVHQANNSDIRVKNLQTGKWWILYNTGASTGFIGSSDSNSGNRTLFEVIKANANTIVLRSRDNGLFCVPVSNKYVQDSLNASSLTAIKASRIQVEEPLFSRDVAIDNNTGFRFNAARFHNHNQDLVLNYSIVENRGSQPITRTITLSKQVTESKSWSNSQTLTTGRSMSFTSGIPVFTLDLEFKIQGQFSETYEWSCTKETKRTISDTTIVIIPPGKRVRAYLKAYTASYDIPFSYSQTDQYDVLDPGTFIRFDDGVFSGSEFYHSFFTTEESPL
ncbi:hypothetical protein vseg_000613 [Gypsophila vaccaria]